MELLVTGTNLHLQLSLKGRKATHFPLHHRTRAAYQTMPNVVGEYCRMCYRVPQIIAANDLEYSEVPVCVQFPRVLLLIPRILRDHLFQYILLSKCCCESATILQKQHLSPRAPIPHWSSKLLGTWKYHTEISKTGPLHIFCIHLLWGLRVFTSPYMVQQSPQLNCISGGITLSNFRSWQPNPTALHRCTFTQCFNARLKFLLHQENWLSPATGMMLQVPGCGMQGAATPQCAIMFCAHSSRSVLFHVFYCVMNFFVVGCLHVVWQELWLLE